MSLESVREVLAHRIAEPASWRSIPVLDSGETAYVFSSPPEVWFQDWQAARRALPRTGRWPIAVSSWGGPDDDEVFSRGDMDTAGSRREPAGDPEPARHPECRSDAR